MRYELLEHTADVMIKAHGCDLEECFANAAYALFDQITDVSKVSAGEEVSFVVSGHDNESLLFNFLSEFLFIHDAKHLVLSEFRVKIKGTILQCTAKGEKIDSGRHTYRHEVKAITYHMLEVNAEEPSVTVILDI
jgi:SHS2 domain-containing protein